MQNRLLEFIKYNVISKWYELKQAALTKRQAGASLREIERSLKIPRSTLSGWFKNVQLTPDQSLKLLDKQLKGLELARTKAVIWHNNQKLRRIRKAHAEASKVLDQIDLNDKAIVELALAILYLREGFKTRVGLGMGNSDPLILKFFINALLNIYKLDENKIKCELHLRADQDPEAKKQYWSDQLGIGIENFIGVSIDQRTIGSTSYATYNGVCVVRCSSIAIQRKLLYLAKHFCEAVISLRAVSSVGRASH